MQDAKRISRHRDLMQSDDLQTSIDFALLEYQRQLATRVQESMAGAGHLRMLGALEFLQTLKTLGEATVPSEVVTPKDLNHRV